MGPFPHDAPPATISAQNPAGTDGFEFVEFAHPDPSVLHDLFVRMGYAEVARHRTKNISLYRQGRINYLINREPNGNLKLQFNAPHGPVYVIEASTNLVDWEKIGVATHPRSGEFEFEDRSVSPYRFYRVTVP